MASLSARAPARSTGLPPGVGVGPLGRRLLAHLVDLAVPAAVVGLLVATEAGRTPTLVGAAVVLAWCLLVWWMFARRAAGPGMRLTRLQLVGLSDGRPIGWGRFLVRALVLAALSVTGLGLVLMVIFLALHRRRQGWHDLVADSVVIKERMLAPPRGQASPFTPAAGAPRVVASPPAPAEVSTPSPAAVLSPAATPSPADVAVPSQETRVRPAQAPHPAPRADPESGWLAVLQDGREIPLRQLMLLGRNPEAGPGEEGAELIPVADSTRTVSKSHLALGWDEEGPYVRDLGSTNGSTITDYSGVSRPCPPGETVRVGEGTIVSFGDLWLEIRRDEAPIGSAHAPVGS